MKKLFLACIFVITIFFSFQSAVFAQPAVDPTPTPALIEGNWIKDQEVTFVGKNASRSNDFLNWTLQNYNWIRLGDSNALKEFWKLVANMVYVILVALILVSAFVIVITRGQNLTIMRFIPRFIFILVLVYFSFALIGILYTAVDSIQGCLLRLQCPGGRSISSADLLYIGFDYNHFLGFRRIGPEFEESAFISLLLLRLTAFTYYVMGGILIVRKIILWFLLIVSPIFPLLLFYAPIRNTAKIWIGEFFRWLLYGPLFALFLHGLVLLWQKGIPLPFQQIDQGVQNKGCNSDFQFDGAPASCYPTAINITLGGPGQNISYYNSVNLKDTFALYVVALIMLWVVILLPFLLLNIFLDYVNSIQWSENSFFKKIINRSGPLLVPPGSTGPTPSPQPLSSAPAGLARALPFMRKDAGAARPFPIGEGATITGAEAQLPLMTANMSTINNTTEIMKLTNLSVPKMRDIARYESSQISRDTVHTREVNQMSSVLQKIANPSQVSTPIERERFTQLRQKLVQQKQKGDPLASSILSASSAVNTRSSFSKSSVTNQMSSVSQILNGIANPAAVPSVIEREKLTNLKTELMAQKQKGDPVATQILASADKISQQNTTSPEKAQVVQSVHDTLTKPQNKDNVVVNKILSEADSRTKTQDLQKAQAFGSAPSPSTPVSLPVVNRVQQVSLEDYEEVKKMWQENYQNLEVPKSIGGDMMTRKQWIQNDMDRINQAVTLLTSADPVKTQEGMNLVANILPFLLIGGFSRTEVIAYLKAKLEAAKSVMSDTEKKQQEEESMIDTKTEKAEGVKHMTMEEKADVPSDKGPKVPPEENPVFDESKIGDKSPK